MSIKLDKIQDILKVSQENRSPFKIKLTGGDKSKFDFISVTIKPFQSKGQFAFQFVYKHERKDITKNHLADKALELIEDYVQSFKNVTIITETKILQWNPQKGKYHSSDNQNIKLGGLEHDHTKKRKINSDTQYLIDLGISSSNGLIKKNKQAKFKQINKYIEIIEPILKSSNLNPDFSVMDMGSGKGYLTFALYEYLTYSLKLNPQIIGVELRDELIDQCNKIASKNRFDNLNFQRSSIADIEELKSDVLIALHACDTATDDAIAHGIKNKSKVIICSPCCHKQIRKQMNRNDLTDSITKFGILKERQAEIITDTIRALIMEYFGYKTQVIEFISTEHTPKNLLLIGKKHNKEVEKESIKEKVKQLKSLYSIKTHYLESILEF